MKKTYKIFLVTCIAMFISLTTNAKVISVKISATQVRRLAKVIASIHHYYVEPVTNEQLINDAIGGMLSKLDPHSSYLDKEDLKSLKIITSGAFDGIGITIVPELSALRVISPMDGSPAEKAGIEAGDIIVRINDRLVRDLTLSKAITMIRGKRGSKVVLYIIRKKEPKPLKITVTRNIVKVPTVKGDLLENHYAYIRIGIFYKTTQKDLLKVIKQLQQQSKEKLYGVILDLRNNPGGLFTPSIQVADDFLDAAKLKENKLIVYTKGYPDNKREDFNANRGELLPDIPIVVIINSGSASAAEIVAGALQDHKRAVILGTRSFGKGSVQTIIPIDKTSAIKLTTALYYTPSARSIQARGIRPDVTVETLKIAKGEIETLPFGPIYEADLLNHIKNNDAKQPNMLQAKTESELMQQDFQLYEALNLVKGLSVLRK